MPKIVFVEFNGTEHHIDAPVGDSLMQAASNNMVPGILADCGGNCACATCHVYIGKPWSAQLKPPSKDEVDMIDCALHVNEFSRLSCQVPIVADLDGMIVRLPESQT